MCDYSLAGNPNRLAVEGEELVVHPFPTGALGLASPNTPLILPACRVFGGILLHQLFFYN